MRTFNNNLEISVTWLLRNSGPQQLDRRQASPHDEQLELPQGSDGQEQAEEVEPEEAPTAQPEDEQQAMPMDETVPLLHVEEAAAGSLPVSMEDSMGASMEGNVLMAGGSTLPGEMSSVQFSCHPVLVFFNQYGLSSILRSGIGVRHCLDMDQDMVNETMEQAGRGTVVTWVMVTEARH